MNSDLICVLIYIAKGFPFLSVKEISIVVVNVCVLLS